MNEQEQLGSVGIRIKSISLDLFEATEAGKKLLTPLGDDDYEFQIAFNFGVEPNDVITTISHFTLRMLSNKTELAKMALSMSFNVVNIGTLAKKDDNGNLVIDQNLGKILASVNISTSRGFFTVHSAPFNFRNAYLPIIDMNKFGQPPQVK